MAQVTIVSNRLPVSVKKVGGKLKFSPGSGGIASGLVSYTEDRKNKWVGWPGIASEELTEEDREIIVRELNKQNCYPVFLTRKQIDGYYNGFSNEALWPLFHSMPANKHDQEHNWVTYRQVNQLFAEIVMGLSQPESVVWVHDYHLLLLPGILRTERPYELIGFFLHTPFPPPKILQKLPHVKSLLKGLVGADLIGFHTADYAENFLDACQEQHVGTAAQGQVILKDRVVNVTDFPLGIDYAKYAKAGNSSVVQRHAGEHKKKYRRQKIILTVDRLEPAKGLVERLDAYDTLLRHNRRLRKKVVMVMLATPSRTDVPAYRRLKEKLEQRVAEINKTYGRRKWQPVDYMYRSLPFEELAALYKIADIAFIAPIRDGMNLVAKEYVASKPNENGVLILSETAGAAQELTDALLVNPKRPKTLVDALTQALTMRPSELKNRLTGMQSQLSSNTIHHWKRTFMTSLQSSRSSLEQPTRRLGGKALEALLAEFKAAKYPLLLIDYDGVLTSFTDKPSAAKPSAETKRLLRSLAEYAPAGVHVISGRGKADLESWLGNLGVTLAAEHGAMVRPGGSSSWRNIVSTKTDWKKLILPILDKYADKAPGAFVEEKDCSLVWHYRKTPPFYAQKYITILQRVLRPLLKDMGLCLYRGHMILEIKSPEANKGVAAGKFLKKKHDFVLAIGDDYTDEDTFAALPPDAYTVKVGRGKTMARFRLNSVSEVHELLQKVAKAKT